MCFVFLAVVLFCSSYNIYGSVYIENSDKHKLPPKRRVREQ